MVYNEKARESIYKWQSENKEKWLAQARKNSKNYYEKNKEEKRAKMRAYYYVKKAQKLINEQNEPQNNNF